MLQHDFFFLNAGARYRLVVNPKYACVFIFRHCRGGGLLGARRGGCFASVVLCIKCSVIKLLAMSHLQSQMDAEEMAWDATIVIMGSNICPF